jgi:hypothetical protein
MSVPSEMIRSVQTTGQFLKALLDMHITPRVPYEIRKEAYRLLRHYPTGGMLDGLLKPEYRDEVRLTHALYTYRKDDFKKDKTK